MGVGGGELHTGLNAFLWIDSTCMYACLSSNHNALTLLKICFQLQDILSGATSVASGYDGTPSGQQDHVYSDTHVQWVSMLLLIYS